MNRLSNAVSSVTQPQQTRGPASSRYQPPFRCTIKWKLWAATLVSSKAKVTFKKAKITTLKLMMEKLVLGVNSIFKHRLNESFNNGTSLLLTAQVKQRKRNQNPCFVAPQSSSTPPDLPTLPSFHNENSDVISFPCRAGLKQELELIRKPQDC